MNFKDYKEELMKDPKFAKAYEELQPEMDAIRAALNAQAPRTPLKRPTNTPKPRIFLHVRMRLFLQPPET